TEHQRFSLAISGGASKGAYEAGLNWALLKLARESENLQTVGGGRIRPLELASIAGASAGGVNTILAGLTWCSLPESEGGIASRIDNNVFRDSWFIMDINGLLPPQPDSKTYLPDDALFSRRDYLVAANDLLESWRKSAYRPGCRVPMGVTVTRVKPLELMVGNLEVQNQRFYIPFELRVQEDGTIGFFFDPADYPGLSDLAMILMPRPRDAPEFSIPDESIIEAAVATSAFPTAFGRRRFQYCRHEVGTGATPAQSLSDQSDSDLVCPDGYLLEEAEFADGGLFDNLPVGLARTLAELSIRNTKKPLPVSYFYIDPDRVRYAKPDIPDNRACVSENPPEACRIMEFSLFSESSLLVGALGTARKYELYRETTSANWRHNLSQLAYELAQIVDKQQADFGCAEELPYFVEAITCTEAIRAAGRFLEIAYDRVKPEILPPYSAERLVEAGVADNCLQLSQNSDPVSRIECHIDIRRYRDQMAQALLLIIKRGNFSDEKLSVRIGRSRQSIHDDRVLRVSSRGAPITGTLLGDFGSFLDLKFREYDYYVGVYDAVTMVTHSLCRLQYLPKQQAKEFRGCVDKMGELLYHAMGVADDPRGRYVFARIAEQESGGDGQFEFSYSPLPPVDRDMQIIHDALAVALEAGEVGTKTDKKLFATENHFFEYLKTENFTPARTGNGDEPLLAAIIADPDTWSTEMTRRFTARLVYLERQAADIYAAREPDPELRENSYTPLMGTTAHILQSATYKYPGFTFSPSTAPEDWVWRYIMPYEFGFDLGEGDILFTWQPTMALSTNNLLNVRASLGFEGGILRSSSDEFRENYLGLGVGYMRRTGSAGVSSFGFTPTWYHTWSQPEIGKQNSAGGDVFVGFLKDRLRVGLGTRDFSDTSNNWFLLLSITDLPGMTYWLTR
ncbi:MAG: hypothetical protein DRQ59_11405, partial [Gammaproteobacteria bacterium]